MALKSLLMLLLASWCFTNEGLAPYEFTHRGVKITETPRLQVFFEELGNLLKNRNLDDVLGVCSLDGQPRHAPATMEFTSGRANITLPFDITPKDGSTIDAIWQSSIEEDRITIRG